MINTPLLCETSEIWGLFYYGRTCLVGEYILEECSERSLTMTPIRNVLHIVSQYTQTRTHTHTLLEKKNQETIVIINMHDFLLCYPILLQNAGFNFLNLYDNCQWGIT